MTEDEIIQAVDEEYRVFYGERLGMLAGDSKAPSQEQKQAARKMAEQWAEKVEQEIRQEKIK